MSCCQRFSFERLYTQTGQLLTSSKNLKNGLVWRWTNHFTVLWFFDFSKIKYSVESWAWSSSCCWPQFRKLACPYSVSWRWLVFHITWYRFPHSRTLLVTQAGLKTNGYDLNKILPVLCILYIGYVSLYTVALCRQCSYLFSLSQIKDLIMRTSV